MKTMIEKILGRPGRLISGSKGGYGFYNPKNVTVFNSNICTEEDGKIWYGDIDLTLEEAKLQVLSNALGKTIYVLYEMDARFENKEKPLLEKAFATVTDSETLLGEPYQYHYEREDGKLVIKEVKYKTKKKPEYNDPEEYLEEDFIAYPLDITLYIIDMEKSPLNQFGEYAVGASERDDLSVTDVYLPPLAYAYLKASMKSWYVFYHEMDPAGYQLHKHMAWLGLEMPCEFYGSVNGPEWAKKDTVYIKRKDE